MDPRTHADPSVTRQRSWSNRLVELMALVGSWMNRHEWYEPCANPLQLSRTVRLLNHRLSYPAGDAESPGSLDAREFLVAVFQIFRDIVEILGNSGTGIWYTHCCVWREARAHSRRLQIAGFDARTFGNVIMQRLPDLARKEECLCNRLLCPCPIP